MNRKFFIPLFAFFILFSSQKTFGQIYLYLSEKSIESLYDYDFFGKNPTSVVLSSRSENVLKVEVDGTENIISKYYFDTDSLCGKIEMYFYCEPCMPNHIRNIFNNRYYKFRKTKHGFYLSRFPTFVRLDIIERPNNPATAMIIFSSLVLPEKEYKSLFKK